MPAPYRSQGKQVLHTVDGLWCHFADAVSSAAAGMIVEALTPSMGYSVSIGPVDEPNRYADIVAPMITEYIANPKTNHRVRQENDEYACSCGMRWDVQDGEDHP